MIHGLKKQKADSVSELRVLEGRKSLSMDEKREVIFLQRHISWLSREIIDAKKKPKKKRS